VWEVRCGSDDDAGKHTRWAQVKEAYPRAEASVRERSPAGSKDGNDALRAAQAQAREQAREEAHPSGRASAKEKDYHDR